MKVSILASVYNEEKTLAAFLHEVLSQRLPASMRAELLICDDASNDATPRLIEIAKEVQGPITLRSLHNPRNIGQSESINTLFQVATGDIVVFIDGDAIPTESTWLVNLIGPIIDDAARVVQGNYWTQYGPKTFVVREHEKWRRSASLRRFRNADGTLKTVNTRNLAVRRDVLQGIYETRGYVLNPNAVCGADTELGFSLTELGYVIMLNEAAVVAHDDPSTLVGVIRQKVRHGFHDGILGISYPNGMSYAVYHPYVKDGVSPFFSLPIAVSFAIANQLGLLVHTLRH